MKIRLSSVFVDDQDKYEQGILSTTFFVEDVQREYDRMKHLGVVFRSKPERIEQGPTVAVFDDTCGNLIQIVQV